MYFSYLLCIREGYLSDSELERRKSVMALRGRRFQIELPYANAFAFYPRCWLLPAEDGPARSLSSIGASGGRHDVEARERDLYSVGGAAATRADRERRLRTGAGESGLDHLKQLDRSLDPYSRKERAGLEGAGAGRDSGRESGRYGYGFGSGRASSPLFDQRGGASPYAQDLQRRTKGTSGWSEELLCRTQRVLHRSLALTIRFPPPKPLGAGGSRAVQPQPEWPHPIFA